MAYSLPYPLLLEKIMKTSVSLLGVCSYIGRCISRGMLQVLIAALVIGLLMSVTFTRLIIGEAGTLSIESAGVERIPPESGKKVGYPVDDVIQFTPLDSSDLPEPGYDRNSPLQL